MRRILEDSARDWLGHCVAIFICGPAGLAEAIPLPGGLGEQAVFGPRPHVRPLLVAVQRHPAYRVVVVNRRHAWLFAVAGDRIDTVTRFAGSFVADTSTMTAARARALASPIIRNWVEKSGQQLVTRIRQEPPGGLAATGLAACLTAVRQHGVHILAMPGQGLVPGVACRRCGAVGTTAASCAHRGSAAFAVPDLIEEIAVSTLHDGGQVQAVPDPPGGIAAYLRFPLSRRDGT